MGINCCVNHSSRYNVCWFHVIFANNGESKLISISITHSVEITGILSHVFWQKLRESNGWFDEIYFGEREFLIFQQCESWVISTGSPITNCKF